MSEPILEFGKQGGSSQDLQGIWELNFDACDNRMSTWKFEKCGGVLWDWQDKFPFWRLHEMGGPS